MRPGEEPDTCNSQLAPGSQHCLSCAGKLCCSCHRNVLCEHGNKHCVVTRTPTLQYTAFSSEHSLFSLGRRRMSRYSTAASFISSLRQASEICSHAAPCPTVDQVASNTHARELESQEHAALLQSHCQPSSTTPAYQQRGQTLHRCNAAKPASPAALPPYLPSPVRNLHVSH